MLAKLIDSLANYLKNILFFFDNIIKYSYRTYVLMDIYYKTYIYLLKDFLHKCSLFRKTFFTTVHP